MALKHAKLFDIIDLQATIEERGTALSCSLLKTDHLQLIQVTLQAGQDLPEHHVAGEVTIQCLSGKVSVVTPCRTGELAAGQLMALPGGERHAVRAHSSATLLVTLLRSA